MSSSLLNSYRVPSRNLLIGSFLLFLLSLLSSYYFKENPSISNEVKSLEKYIKKQQADFYHLLKDSTLLRRLVEKEESEDEYKLVGNKAYGVFLYAETLSEKSELIFWNNQRVLPGINELSLPEGEYFQLLPNGYYVVLKKNVRLTGLGISISAYAIIPVQYQYDYETDYLLTQFAHNKIASRKIFISEKQTPFPIYSINNKPLFYIGHKAHSPQQTSDPFTLFLRIASILLLLACVHYAAKTFAVKNGMVRSTIFITIVLAVLRLLLYLYPNLLFVNQFQLFDPTIYSSNWINRSLGDLLINAFLLCWISVFAWYNLGPQKKIPSFLKGNRIYFGGIVTLFVLILFTFELANIVRSMVADSKISFNVINFFSLDIYTVVGFVVLALLSLMYYYFTRMLFRFIFSAFAGKAVFIYFSIAVIGLIYLSFHSGNTIVLFHLPVLLWLVIYTLLLSEEKFVINRFVITMAGVLFWIFIFSISLAGIILQENKKKEWATRKIIAEKHDELTDPSQERTLSIALAYLDNKFLSRNFNRFTNEYANRYIRDSITNKNFLVGYRNAYTTKIYVFDAFNRPLYNDEAKSYAELNNIFSLRSKPTGIPGLYYHETSFDNLTYITKRIVQGDSAALGTLFIISTPKKYAAEAFYPELFRQINQSDIESSPIYSYAIYNNKLLIAASNKYSFQTSLTVEEMPVEEFERRSNGTYDELWFKASNNKVVVIAKKQDSLIESITLFSYLFCAFLFMVGLLQLIAYVLSSNYGWKTFIVFPRFSIRSQVHGTIIFISILSFLIIGIATISFFIARYNRNNVDKLSRTSGIMVREMQKRLEDNSTFDDVVKIYDSVSNYNLQKLIEEVSDIHNVDVNVYDLQGNLQVSSRADVYKRGILSSKIHPQAYYHLNRLRQVQYVQEESMSSLKYLSIYAAVRDANGKVYAYLNIPYFLSQLDLNQEISNFLVTIINLNAFIFLIAGVIALFITNRITRSFSIIGDKMKEVQVGKTNEEIEWNFKDEIGELVIQYNKMVRQLEQSAEALAKSEREGAWREMARQVAHEIKNPLTPMKLSIQYLQKAINANQPNIKDLTSNVANTLVEQIDHLSKIAADFSRFANIENKTTELFDLHHVLTSLVDLYRSNPKVQIVWHKVNLSLLVEADKTHMNRLFTNLLTNAVDSCEVEQKCIIEINEEIKDGNVILEIKDNGEGIVEETRAKIFTPNFTTKTSGTGLGLAMCKSIVEQANGIIWFETEVAKGTSFFVQLPLIK